MKARYRSLVALGALAFCFRAYSFPVPSEEQRASFVSLFRASLSDAVSSWKPSDSDSTKLYNSDSYGSLQRMGLEALPLIYEASVSNTTEALTITNGQYSGKTLDIARNRLLNRLWSDKTGRFTSRVVDVDVLWAGESIAEVWEGGDAVADRRASFLLGEMRAAKAETRRLDERRARVNLALMGVFSFPTLFGELERGGDDVVDVLRMIEWNGIPTKRPEATRSGFMSWWKANKSAFSLPAHVPGRGCAPRLGQWKRMESASPAAVR